MTEAEIQRDILKYLHEIGYMAWSTHGPRNRPAVPGVPDIIGVKDGRMIAVEVKGPSGKVSAQQESFMDRLEEAGAIVVVARSLEDVWGV